MTAPPQAAAHLSHSRIVTVVMCPCRFSSPRYWSKDLNLRLSYTDLTSSYPGAIERKRALTVVQLIPLYPANCEASSISILKPLIYESSSHLFKYFS